MQQLTEIREELEELSETAKGVKFGDREQTLEEFTKTDPSIKDLRRHYAKWTSGGMVTSNLQ
eukprot:3057973-Rhodomonas_salina.1